VVRVQREVLLAPATKSGGGGGQTMVPYVRSPSPPGKVSFHRQPVT
jgi:hypothetical protein